MFTRIRTTVGLALLLSLLFLGTASAKGGFDFITISGPNIKEPVRVTDAALTEDFFAFANFYENKTKEPADPGEGYEILRYYIDGKREIIFDRLHYYPETGLVFYDGIENGGSEYDDAWYIAKPEIKTIFESALSTGTGPVAPPEKKEPVPASSQAENPIVQPQPAEPGLPFLTVLAVGLAAFFAFAFWRRRAPVRS